MNDQILKENKSYQFYILTGSHISHIEKINFESYEIFYCPFESDIRKKIFSELEGFEQMFEDEDVKLFKS